MKSDRNFFRIYINWIIFLIFIPIIISGFHAYKTQNGNHPMTITGLIVTNSIFLFAILMVYSCSIEIGKNNIIVKYGIGLIRKRISIDSIKSVELIDNKYKFSPKASNLKDWKGYHVFTFEKKAILIRLKDKRTGIIIGFKDSQELLREIEKNINGSQV
jgi:hypothetical protein